MEYMPSENNIARQYMKHSETTMQYRHIVSYQMKIKLGIRNYIWNNVLWNSAY